jgi:hypothetical protein
MKIRVRLLLAIGLFPSTVAFSMCHAKPRLVAATVVRLRSPDSHNHRDRDTMVPPLFSLLKAKRGLHSSSLVPQLPRSSLFRKISWCALSVVLYSTIWFAIWSGPAIPAALEMTLPTILAHQEAMLGSSPVSSTTLHAETVVAKPDKTLQSMLTNPKAMQQDSKMVRSKVQHPQDQDIFVTELFIYLFLTLLAHLLFPNSVILYFFLGLLISVLLKPS